MWYPMLKRTQFVRVSTLFFMMAANLQSAAQVLERFQWENRLILVRTEKVESREIMRQFADQRAAIEERHIVWFVLEGNVVETNYEDALPENFAGRIGKAGYWKGDEKVLLVGKDGGVKARQETLDLEALFRRIDSMPMRRAEMRQQR